MRDEPDGGPVAAVSESSSSQLSPRRLSPASQSEPRLSQTVSQSAEPHVPYDGKDFAPLVGCSLNLGQHLVRHHLPAGRRSRRRPSVAYRFRAGRARLLFAWLGRPPGVRSG